MIVLKILGILLTAFLIFIFVLLLFPINLFFSAKSGQKTEFSVKYLGIDLTKIGKNNKANQKRQKAQKAKKEKKSVFDFFSSQSGETIEAAKQILGIITSLLSRVLWLLPRCRLKKLRIIYVCADSSAAACALKYGAVCAFVYPFVAFLQTNMKHAENAEEISLTCDFEKEDDDFSLEIGVKVPTALLFAAAVYVIWKYVKEKAESERM